MREEDINPSKVNRNTFDGIRQRDWDDTTPKYRYLYFVPSSYKHDSGWHCIKIVGLREDDGEFEIITQVSDAVFWHTGEGGRNLNTDMTYPSGICRFWSYSHNFRLGTALSSIDIYLERREE